MNENEIIKSVLQEELLSDIDFYNSLPDHRFSHRFNKRIKKLLKENTAYIKEKRYIPFNRKLKIALIAAILAVLFTGAAFGVYTIWDKYRVKDYSLYSMLYISEPQGVPRILEEKYEPDWDFSNYEKIVYLDIENQYLMEYQNYSDDIGVSFEQSTYEVGEQTFINTENALGSSTPTGDG